MLNILTTLSDSEKSEQKKSINDMSEKNEEVVFIESDGDLEFEHNTSSKYAQVYFVKPMLKADKPHFHITWKQGNKNYYRDIDHINGKLVKVVESSYVFNDETVETLKFNFEVKNNNGDLVLLILGSSYTSIMRNFINSLLSYNKPIEKVNLALYRSKQNFVSLACLIDDSKVSWKYSWQEQQKLVDEIKNKKGEIIQRDYAELNEKLKDDLFDHISTIIPDHLRVIPESDAESHFADETDTDETNEVFGEAEPTKKEPAKRGRKATKKTTSKSAKAEEENFFDIDED